MYFAWLPNINLRIDDSPTPLNDFVYNLGPYRLQHICKELDVNLRVKCDQNIYSFSSMWLYYSSTEKTIKYWQTGMVVSIYNQLIVIPKYYMKL